MEHFERLTENRTARIIGAILAVAVLITSAGLLAAARAEPKTSKRVSVLPDAPLDIPNLRSWPYPDLRAETLASYTVSRRVDAQVKGRAARPTLTARR